MGDRCYVRVHVHPDDRDALVEGLGQGEPENEDRMIGYLGLSFSEVNYGASDDFLALAERRLRFVSYAGAGDGYGPLGIASWGDETAVVSLDWDDRPAVPYPPSEREVEDAKRFIAIEDRMRVEPVLSDTARCEDCSGGAEGHADWCRWAKDDARARQEAIDNGATLEEANDAARFVRWQKTRKVVPWVQAGGTDYRSAYENDDPTPATFYVYDDGACQIAHYYGKGCHAIVGNQERKGSLVDVERFVWEAWGSRQFEGGAS